MDLGVHEDVVRVQLHVLDRLGGVDHGAGGQHGGVGNPRVDVGDNGRGGGTGAGTTDGNLLLHGQAQEQISGGNEEDAVLGLNLNRDKTLSVGDAHGSNGEPTVAAKPEQQGNPQIQGRLRQLGRLRSVQHLHQLARGSGGRDGRTDGSAAVLVLQVVDEGRPAGGTSNR